MKKNNIFSAIILSIPLVLLSGIQSVNANGINISYETTDLADINIGEDLWQYTYSVSDHAFAADTGFSIYFDLGLYSNLQDPAPFVNSDWDILTLQPDLALPDDGLYDAYALVDSPSLTDLFTVNFVWLGINALPSSQSFELYDSAFNIIDSGFTQVASVTPPNPVPEPQSIFLIGLGLFGLIYSRKSKTTIDNKNIPLTSYA